MKGKEKARREASQGERGRKKGEGTHHRSQAIVWLKEKRKKEMPSLWRGKRIRFAHTPAKRTNLNKYDKNKPLASGEMANSTPDCGTPPCHSPSSSRMAEGTKKTKMSQGKEKKEKGLQGSSRHKCMQSAGLTAYYR